MLAANPQFVNRKSKIVNPRIPNLGDTYVNSGSRNIFACQEAVGKVGYYHIDSAGISASFLPNSNITTE